MPWFVKREVFRKSAKKLSHAKRKEYINLHLEWVEEMQSKDFKIYSGYLIDCERRPGGGGLLIFNAKSYQQAKKILENDPMVSSGLVEWDLYEWNLIAGNKLI